MDLFPALFGISINWGRPDVDVMLLRLAIATVLGGLVGVERERLERAAGFRTHALVCVASALIMIVSTYGFPTDGSAASLDPSRIAAQVVSGIGFLGAGVIIFRGNTIRGLTTAASIWAVAGVGLAAGGGLYAAAIAGTGFMLLISAGLRPVERKIFSHHASMHRVLITTTNGSTVLNEVKSAMLNTSLTLRSMQFDRRDKKGHVLVELDVVGETPDEVLAMVNALQSSPDMLRVNWRRGGSSIRSQGSNGIRTRDFRDDDEDEQ